MPSGVGLVFSPCLKSVMSLFFAMFAPFSEQGSLKSERWSGLLYVTLTGKVMRSLDRAPLTSPRRNNEQPLALSCHFKPRLSNGLPERLAAPTRLLLGKESGKKSEGKKAKIGQSSRPWRSLGRLFIPSLFIVPRGAFQSVGLAGGATPLHPLWLRSSSRLHVLANTQQMTIMPRSRVAPSMPCPRCVTCPVWWRRLGLGGCLIIHFDRLS